MNPMLPLRIIQGLFAFILLGLSAYCVDVTVGYQQAAFMVFASVWTFAALAYLVLTPMYFPDLHNRWAVIGCEGVTMLFWFAGFIAMADSIDHVICIGNGCRLIDTAKAAIVFGTFEWLAWASSFVLIIHALYKYSKEEAEGNETTNPNPTFLAKILSFFSRRKEGENMKEKNASDVEMGEQTPQSFSTKTPTPRLPEVAHFEPMTHPNGNITDEYTENNYYGHPPSTNSTPFVIPDAADFGGIRDDTPKP